MTFFSHPLLSICWSVMIVGEWYLSFLCLRNIRSKYPAFTLFICYSGLKSVALMFVSNVLGGSAYFCAYYVSGLLAAGLEIAVVTEIFAKLFRPYRYIPNRILGVLTFAVPICVAFVSEINMLAWHGSEDSLLGTCRVVERAATYAVLVLFGGLFCFSSYFDMQWRSRLAGIALGMFINSVSSVVTTTLATSMGRAATARLAFVPVLSFCACVATWIRYIRRPEELRAVVGPGEMSEIRAMLNEFNLCLARADEGSPTEERKS